MRADQEQVGGHHHGERVDEPVGHEAAHVPQTAGELGRGLEDAHRAEQGEERCRVLHVPQDAAQGARHSGADDAAAQDHQGAGEELALGNVVVNGEPVEGLHDTKREQRQHDLDRTVEQLGHPVLTGGQGGCVQGHEDQGDRLDRQAPQSEDQGVTQQEPHAPLMACRHRTEPSTSRYGRSPGRGSQSARRTRSGQPDRSRWSRAPPAAGSSPWPSPARGSRWPR